MVLQFMKKLQLLQRAGQPAAGACHTALVADRDAMCKVQVRNSTQQPGALCKRLKDIWRRIGRHACNYASC
jgi:hypothetical protein